MLTSSPDAAPFDASGVTPGYSRLKFVPANASSGVAARTHRRLMLRDGWRLEGNLHTLGYFSAEICVGTPPRTFDLIADTGSALMAMPCAGCSHCGHHKTGARFDVKAHRVPAHLSSMQLHALPIVLMLPAKAKGAPFALFHGNARPKELLYFARAHASFAFDLPPNPHLTREQHAAWKEQVQQLPADKVEKAYATLKRETGLERDEL